MQLMGIASLHPSYALYALLADFFQRVAGLHADAEAHAQHPFFARPRRRTLAYTPLR